MMGMYDFDFQDKSGLAISQREWEVLFADETYKRIARDALFNGEVSTVWIGLPGTLFETAVFGVNGWDGYIQRYESLEEAQKGHLNLVTAIVSGEDMNY
jgi:hypothetical protein